MLIFFSTDKFSSYFRSWRDPPSSCCTLCWRWFFGGSMDSALLSETSGHYSNNRTKYAVEGLFLKPSYSHHWAVTLLQGCLSLLSTVVQAVELLHDLQHALSFGLWQHQEYKNSHGQAVCQENDETQITKSFLQESKEKKCVHKHLSWFLSLML